MRNSNSMNVARRHVIAHCIVLAASLWASGFAHAQTAAQKPAQTPGTILVVGDSLSAEYGLKRGTGWVALMQARLASQGLAFQVVNASISGDTTAGGRSRLPALLARHKPSHVVIELGANDALRGLALGMTEANLSALAEAATQAGARVTVVGMQVPPNYGPAYGRDFSQLFAQVAHRYKAAYVPFLLKGVADVPDAAKWFQADRIHPNEQAHPLILDNVWPVLRPQLK